MVWSGPDVLVIGCWLAHDKRREKKEIEKRIVYNRAN